MPLASLRIGTDELRVTATNEQVRSAPDTLGYLSASVADRGTAFLGNRGVVVMGTNSCGAGTLGTPLEAPSHLMDRGRLGIHPRMKARGCPNRAVTYPARRRSRAGSTEPASKGDQRSMEWISSVVIVRITRT